MGFRSFVSVSLPLGVSCLCLILPFRSDAGAKQQTIEYMRALPSVHRQTTGYSHDAILQSADFSLVSI